MGYSHPHALDTPESRLVKDLSNTDLNERAVRAYRNREISKYPEIFAEVLKRLASHAFAKNSATGITPFVIGIAFGRLVDFYQGQPYEDTFPIDFPESGESQMLEGFKIGSNQA